MIRGGLVAGGPEANYPSGWPASRLEGGRQPSLGVFAPGETTGSFSASSSEGAKFLWRESTIGVSEASLIAAPARTLTLLTVVLGTAAPFLPYRPWRVTQPVAFNHNLHVEEVGAECADCHRWALSGVRATIPNVEVCVDCHEEVQGESAEEAQVVEYVTTGQPIPWQKVYRVPAHVYFSHRRHTAIAGLECEVCHGQVGERTEPVTRPHRRPTMNDCMECHDQSGASNDCIHCHH